jgi:hypothetical protein
MESKSKREYPDYVILRSAAVSSHLSTTSSSSFMAPSNLAVLTRSHNAIAAKKRAKRDQIKEIIFDDEARRCRLADF